MSAMALNLKRMAKAIFSAIYMDKIWAENMISQPIFYLCQQVQYLTLPSTYQDTHRRFVNQKNKKVEGLCQMTESLNCSWSFFSRFDTAALDTP